MIKAYYLFYLSIPSEKTYRRGDIFHGWDWEDGIIANIMETFGLEEYKDFVKTSISDVHLS
jgi:hypothetical protein